MQTNFHWIKKQFCERCPCFMVWMCGLESCFLLDSTSVYYLNISCYQDILQKLLKDPTIQECKANNNEDALIVSLWDNLIILFLIIIICNKLHQCYHAWMLSQPVIKGCWVEQGEATIFKLVRNCRCLSIVRETDLTLTTSRHDRKFLSSWESFKTLRW